MAEKRMVSKSISISERVNLLPDIFDMLLFTWLIPHTDDFGRLTGSPAKVKALVVPMLDKTIKDIEQSLQRQHDAGLIVLYEVDGDKFIQIVNFEKHQSGLHKRTKSKIPDIPGNSGKFREIPLEQNRTEENLTEEKGTEQKGNDVVSVPTFDNPHNTKIQEWLKKYKVEVKGIVQLEEVFSYVGVVDIEVIEHCIKQSENKHVPYFVSVIERLRREGKTTKESIVKASEGSEKSQGELRHEQSAAEDKPITGGKTGALPSKWSSNIVQMPKVSG